MHSLMSPQLSLKIVFLPVCMSGLSKIKFLNTRGLDQVFFVSLVYYSTHLTHHLAMCKFCYLESIVSFGGNWALLQPFVITWKFQIHVDTNTYTHIMFVSAYMDVHSSATEADFSFTLCSKYKPAGPSFVREPPIHPLPWAGPKPMKLSPDFNRNFQLAESVPSLTLRLLHLKTFQYCITHVGSSSQV